jgi:hypothetical protein
MESIFDASSDASKRAHLDALERTIAEREAELKQTVAAREAELSVLRSRRDTITVELGLQVSLAVFASAQHAQRS